MSVAGLSASGIMPALLFDYEILDRLGEGAHSVIYAAAHPVSKQLCAVKHVRIRFDKEMRFFEQLENELVVGQFVNHRAVRQSLEIKTRHDRPGGQLSEAILVMEFFDGIALDQWLPEHARAALPVFIRAAKAIGLMHKAGLVHCDIKPANILANEPGDIRIIDLGQACRAGTRKKRLQGTPDYIAPEQARLDPVTPRTDIYNFGATMYRLLTEQTLPTVLTPDGHIIEPPPPAPPHKLNEDVNPEISALVMECVRTNPDGRPATMLDVIKRLESVGHATN